MSKVLEQTLTPGEVARHLKVRRRWVTDNCRPGRIWPVYRISPRDIRVPVSSVLTYLETLNQRHGG